MWPSLPAANHIADIANWFFIGSLVVGVVSTVLIVWMSGVKEAYWDKDRTESAERVALLTVQGDQLRKETAEANERALEAKVALEKFKAPRYFTPEQQESMVSELLLYAGTPFDFSVNPSPEPDALMGQIADVLTKAKWEWKPKQTSGGIVMSSGSHPQSGVMTSFVGLGIEIDSSKQTEWAPALSALASAFRTRQMDIKANVALDGSATPDAIHIYVGIKP